MNTIPWSYHFRSLVRRPSRAVFTLCGIGLSVFVALVMIGLADGLTSSIRATGNPLNVLVTAKGAETIEFSALSPETTERLRHSPGVAESNGITLASPEILFAAAYEHNGRPTQALIRGVRPEALMVHDQVKVTEGRFPSAPGEILVGPLVAARLGLPMEPLAVGRELVIENHPWKIVGRFEAPGTAFEAEIWGLLDEWMVHMRKDEFNAVVLRAADAEAFEEMLFDFDARTDVLVAARPETDYYAAHAASFRPLQSVVMVMAALLTVGGSLIGMNTLYASVAGRTREIGLLRTVGYRRFQIGLGFLAEGLLPAIAGAVLACVLILPLQGMAFRIPMGAFRLEVDPALWAIGLALGFSIGLLGSAAAVFRAVQLKTIQAIRHL